MIPHKNVEMEGGLVTIIETKKCSKSILLLNTNLRTDACAVSWSLAMRVLSGAQGWGGAEAWLQGHPLSFL